MTGGNALCVIKVIFAFASIQMYKNMCCILYRNVRVQSYGRSIQYVFCHLFIAQQTYTKAILQNYKDVFLGVLVASPT